LKRMLHSLGIDDERFRLEWISASEGEKVKTVINDMVDKLKALGPLSIPNQINILNEELKEIPEELAESFIGKEELSHV
ncbi:MAG: hydrogenase iron-sulfur subunit, partial [Ignavibacteria bacterium]|nr:hydrogenase iron-sulfur subunit [Ignavibacteria bacterium]